jgi:hypothetical protein
VVVNYEKVSETLKALAHPARLKMVVGLLKDECNVYQNTEGIGTTSIYHFPAS